MLVSSEPDVILGFSRALLVADAKGAAFEWWPPQHHSVFNIAVAPSARRQGIARRMFDRLNKDAKTRFSGVGVCCRVEPSERQIYKRLGLEHHPARDVFFEAGAALPKWAESTTEFNARFLPHTSFYDSRGISLQARKIKYFIFTRSFEEARG